MVHIKIIIGSVRPGRFGVQPAEWIHTIGQQYAKEATFEVIDVKELGLPFLDEPVPASVANKNYTNVATTKWSKVIDSADGFIFVTPEYNHSYSPALKNAIDHLYSEWHFKPVSFVSYGASVGGAYAVEHLRNVVAWLKMYDLADQIILPQYYLNTDDQGIFAFDEDHERRAKNLIEQTIFWSKAMKPARKEHQANAQA